MSRKLPVDVPEEHEYVKDDFQSVLCSLRTLMFINTINGSLDGM